MTAALQPFAELALVEVLAWAVCFRLLPWLWRRRLPHLTLDPLLVRRLARFRSMRAGWLAFMLMVSSLVASQFLELYCDNLPLYIRWHQHVQFPAVARWGSYVLPFHTFDTTLRAADFGQPGPGDLDVRQYARHLPPGGAILMPLYPYWPEEQLLNLPGTPPYPPFQSGLPVLGTDGAGRDVLSQLLYGFRTSVSFGLLVAFVGYGVGISVGACMGWFGGWFDIVVQRGIEIWGSIPFLYAIMILASIVRPGFATLCLLNIVMYAWIGITWYMRGEFYREKSKDYVQAARALGLNDATILVRHILPNALVPVVTFLPFDIVGFMSTLVALDFLGLGLPPGTPSWGVLLQQGADNIVTWPYLVYLPVAAFAGTLFCVVLIGEAIREAFDPKPYARLR